MLKFLALALLCAGPVLSQAPGNRPFNQSTQGYPPTIPIKGSAFFPNAVVYTDGQGFLETVTGLGTNCVLVSGGSGACGGLLFGTLAAIPATCSVGSTLYQATDQAVGHQMRACTSTNTWTEVVAGALQASLNLSDLGSASTARTNLGLGTAATQSTGTSGATLGLLNANLTFGGLNAYGTPASIDLLHATDLPAPSLNSGALANGMTGTTQSPGDSTSKLATDAFVLANAGGLPQLTSSAYSASLSLTATSTTLSQWIVGALTGNLSISISGLTSGQLVGFEFAQDGTGGRTVAVTSPAGWPTIYVNPTASTTTDLFFKIDSSGVGHCLNCTSVGIGVESAMPGGNPVSGTQFSLFDSTAHFPRAKNSSGTIFQWAKELTAGNIRCAGGAATADRACLAGDMPPISLPTPGTSTTLSGPSEYFACTSTCTITVPVPAAGVQYCVFNDDNVSTAITLLAIGSSARYENTARTAYGTAGTGTFVSGGAVGDKICIVGRDATHYFTLSYLGTWVAN